MEEHSFRGLSKAISDSAISRGRALKLVGAVLLGAFGLVGLPSMAEAKRKKKKHFRHHPLNRMPPSPQLRPPCQPFQAGCPSACTCKGTCVPLPTGLGLCFPT